MASEFDTTGTIARTSKSSCVISVPINDVAKSFSVSKTIFYTYGVKCDGDLTNLVEDGMEVDLCYRLGPGGSPTIVSVWLGEKPDPMKGQGTRPPVYEHKGVLSDVGLDVLVVDSDIGKVLVKKSVTFRDGERDISVSPNEEITFDAIPLRDGDLSSDGALYQATCAWIGRKPTLVDRFHLQIDETEDFEFVHDVSGTVVVIPSNVVAFAEVEVECVTMKVMVFRSSFRHGCDRIQDVVDVGDQLCMRLGYAFVFPGCKQLFARRAVKASDEVTLDELGSSESVESEVSGNDETDQSDETDDESVDNNGRDRSVETDRTSESIQTGKNSAKNTVDAGTAASSWKQTHQFDKDSPILYSDTPLTGVLSRFHSYGCITFGSLKVLLGLSNFYLDEKPGILDLPYLAASRETVNFEATLINRKEELCSGFSHEATCAWVGKKPTLSALVSFLPPPKFELIQETGQIFYGKVIKICFPSVALADIPGESVVSVHVNHFACGPQYPTKGPYRNLIGCYVKIDDWIQFKVQRTPIAPKFLTAFDARPASFTAETLAKINSGIAVSRGPCESSSAEHVKSNRSKPEPAKAPSSSPEPAVCIATAFKNGILSQGRAYLIDCIGTIRTRPNQSTVTVDHAFGSFQLNSQTVYVSDNKIVDFKSIPNGLSVHFDAQGATASNSNFDVKRIWKDSVRTPSEVLLFSELSLFEGITTRSCPAKIISIPLYDAAIASVRGVPILVPFESLVTLQEVNMACSCIDTLVKVGEFVGVEFEKRKFPGQMSGSYFRAVRCWSLSKGGSKITLDDEIRIASPRINSWFSLWGHGQFFCSSAVNRVGQKYFVVAQTKTRGLLSLDIFEKGKVCVDGELVEAEECNLKDGTPVCYHVGHDYVEDTSVEKSEPKYFVAWSWVGAEPSPEGCMRNVLAVPKGSVACNRHYEVVVQSFPTPYHALCLLGYVSVLVPLPKAEGSRTRACIEDVNLKRGDRIVVNVLEKDVMGVTVLVSNTTKIKKVKDCVYQDVLKNVCGKIEALPNPTGLIKPHRCSFMVSFELCNLRRLNKSQGSDKVWFESVKYKINLGKKVYFSAVKVGLKAAPYRAYEVFFD